MNLTDQAIAQLADLTVPAQNSAANATMRDVIGNKTDNSLGNSIYSVVNCLRHHFFTESKVYPTLAVGATVVSAAANWAYGAYATIVPAATITVNFHVHDIAIETCDKNAVFQLELYKGAADDVIAGVRFAVIGGFWGNSLYALSSERVAANERVRIRLASSDGALNQATMTLSIGYCEEPC